MERRKGSRRTAKKPEKKMCTSCKKEKNVLDFYISYNPLHGDQRTPYCKECFKDACYNESGEFDFERFKSLLRQIDRPFLPSLWKAAEDEVLKNTGSLTYEAAIGKYMKNISMQQNRKKTWQDGFQDKESIDGNIESSKRKSSYSEKVYYLTDENFEVTEDMIRLFGEGYTAKEYETMNRIYDNTKQEYPNMNSNQRNLLLRYVRLAAKEEIATSSGAISEAEKWSRMASEALKQLNAVDTQGGLSCFAEFFMDFERTKDVSRILPKFKYRPNDAVDFIIYCYINYCRRLEGKPEIDYADVYKFYDDKVAEYIAQYGDPYGIFKDDPTINNRDKIQEFITLPPTFEGDDENGN